MRRATAPVKAPFSWPKNSLSMRSRGIAVQFTATKGRSRRGERRWIARATSSLPVPVSPRRSTVASASATCSTIANTSRIAGEVADDLLEPGRPLELAVQARHVAPLPLVRDGVAEHERELVVADRLREVVERPLAHRLHRGLDGRVRGDEHDRQRGAQRVDALHERDAVHVRHLEVGDERERVGLGEPRERLGAAGRDEHLEPLERRGSRARPCACRGRRPRPGRGPPARPPAGLTRLRRAGGGGPRLARCGAPGSGSPRPCRRRRAAQSAKRARCCSTARVTTTRPSPVPVAFVVTNGRSTSSSWSAGIPQPRSRTSTTIVPFAARRLVAARELERPRAARVEGVLEQVHERLGHHRRVDVQHRQVRAEVERAPRPRGARAPPPPSGRRRAGAGSRETGASSGSAGRATWSSSEMKRFTRCDLVADEGGVLRHLGVAARGGAAGTGRRRRSR